MTRLVDALRELGLPGEIANAGRWVTLTGERCRVHVVETPRGDGYFTWCDDPAARTVEHYTDPVQAITTGLRRAALADHDAGEQRGG